MRGRNLAVFAVSILSMTIAGCSSSTAAKSTTTSSQSPAASGQNPAADKELAASANLKLSDFPTGWTSNPSQNTVDANDKKLSDQLASCLHVSIALFKPNDPAAVDSPEFDDPNGNTAQSTIDYQASTSAVSGMMTVIEGSKFPPCMTAALKALVDNEIAHPSDPSNALPAGASIGNVTFAPMSFPTYGDGSTAFRVTIPISYKGISLDGYFDLVVAQKGRAVVSMKFFGSGSPFDASTEQQLSGLVVGRVT